MELSFERFQLFPRNRWEECYRNSLEVYDGNSKSGDSLGIYCDLVVPKAMKSSSRYMRVRFTSKGDYFSLYSGFKATFNAVDKQSKCKMFNRKYN